MSKGWSRQGGLPRRLLLFALVGVASRTPATFAKDSLRLELSDEEVGSRWIYDDWEAARAQAARQKKPLFVLFRCVP